VEDVYERINDHRGLIKGFDIPTRNKLHQDHLNWVNDTLKIFAYDPNLTICLVTHHPLLQTRIVYPQTDCAFTSNYFDLVNMFSYIFTGHTHFNEDFYPKYSTCRIISNCRGYKTARKYDNSKIVQTFI
jgi:hypothetical protein